MVAVALFAFGVVICLGLCVLAGFLAQTAILGKSRNLLLRLLLPAVTLAAMKESSNINYFICAKLNILSSIAGYILVDAFAKIILCFFISLMIGIASAVIVYFLTLPDVE